MLVSVTLSFLRLWNNYFSSESKLQLTYIMFNTIFSSVLFAVFNRIHKNVCLQML